MRIKKSISSVLVLSMMMSLYACKKADDKDVVEETETTIEEIEATPTPTVVPTATNTPAPTSTPTPIPAENYEFLSVDETIAIYTDFIAEYSVEHPDATYLFTSPKIGTNPGNLDASEYYLKVEDGSMTRLFRILRNNEVALLLEFDDSFMTRSEIMATGDERLDDLGIIIDYIGNISNHEFTFQIGSMEYNQETYFDVVISTDGDIVKVHFDNAGYDISELDVYAVGRALDVIASFDVGGYSAEDIINTNYPIRTNYNLPISNEVADGTYYGQVENITNDGLWLLIGEPISWSGITATGCDDQNRFYFVYNGNTYFQSQVYFDAYTFIGEYSSDFQNRDGYVTIDEEVMYIPFESISSIPFAEDCELVFSGDWDSINYNRDGSFSVMTGSEGWQETPVWVEFIGREYLSRAQNITIENNQITSVEFVVGAI